MTTCLVKIDDCRSARPNAADTVSLARDRRMALKDEVRRRLGVGDGPFELTARAWVVTGRNGPAAA